MRTALTLMTVVALAGSLAACSSPGGTTSANADCAVTKSGSASEAVKVSGKFGAEPKISLDTPITLTATERSSVIAGDGAMVSTGDQVQIDFVFLNGTSGKELTKTGYAAGSTALFAIDEAQYLPGIVKTLNCSTVGSRVVGVIPPIDAWGDVGSADFGVAGTDAIVFVVDIVGVVPSRATGTDQPAEDGFPTVVLAKDGAPTVTVPKSDPPAGLKLSVLKKGDGAVVADGASVTVQYQGINWRTGKVFDQSWGSAPATFSTAQVVAGFAQGMVGQTVGSQVIVIIPPDLGYGPSGGNEQAGILADDTLVFVIDILSAQ